MIKDSFCCPHCFDNQYIQQHIEENYEEIGDCPYCKTQGTHLISLRKMGIHLRDCIEKAYEGCDDGTGAMYDSEEKMYLGPDGEEATVYSIREILTDVETIFTEDTIETTLIDDLFENLYSDRDIQKGAKDPYDDIDSQCWVVKDAFSKIKGKVPTIKELNTEYAEVLAEKKKTYAEYRKARQEMKDYQTAKYNIDRFLQTEEQEKQAEKQKTTEKSI